MQDIAAKFSDEKYHAAAKQFRLPYWDWIKPRQERTTEFPGQGQGGNDTVSFPYSFDMPLACQKEQLRVYQPGDETKLVSIANPLLTYHFPKKNSVTTADWKLLDDQDDEDASRCLLLYVLNGQLTLNPRRICTDSALSAILLLANPTPMASKA